MKLGVHVYTKPKKEHFVVLYQMIASQNPGEFPYFSAGA